MKFIKKNKTKCITGSFAVILFFVFISMTKNIFVFGAESLKLYDFTTKQTSVYTGKRVSFICNDAMLAMNDTPGIITNNGVALGSYEHIFKEAFGSFCVVRKSNQWLRITDGKISIKMKIGSKTAYVNGKKVSMNAAPVTYKYSNNGQTLTLVPTRFVAETLGYKYRWDSTTSTVSIKRPIHISYQGKDMNYTGIMAAASFDGSMIDLSDLPGIILSNTIMFQAERLFQDILDVDYQYDLSTGQLSFSKGKLNVVMTLHSNEVTINEKRFTCETAPTILTNKDIKESYVVVPVRFLAEALGYSYVWDGLRNISMISTTEFVGVRSRLYEDSNRTENGESGELLGEAKEYFQWISKNEYNKTISVAEQAFQETLHMQEIISPYSGFGSISSIYKEINDSNAPNISMMETYIILMNTPVTFAEAIMQDGRIDIHLLNTIGNDDTYQFDGNLVSDIEVQYDADSISSMIFCHLNYSNSGYKIKLSEDGLRIILEVYPNYINGVSAGIRSNGTEFVAISALEELACVMKEDENNVYLTFPNAVNTIGEQQYAPSDTENLIPHVSFTTQNEYSSLCIIQKPYIGAKHYTISEDGVYYILFDSLDLVPAETSITNLLIPIPEHIDPSSITSEDQYYKKRIVLHIPGNHLMYYQNTALRTNHPSVSNLLVQYSSTQNVTEIIIETNQIQAYKINAINNYLDVTITNPRDLYSKIVVLDAGHGGIDPGTSKGNIKEKDIVFKIINEYTQSYFDDSDIKVYLTRVDDTKIDLYDRASFSLEVGADFFVSLHVNASTSSAPKGTSVYYSSKNTNVGETGLTSKILASSFQKNLVSTLGTKNLGVLTADFVVVRENTVPSILIELAFLSNPSDYKLLTDSNMQKKVGKSIYQTIVSVFQQYPTNR